MLKIFRIKNSIKIFRIHVYLKCFITYLRTGKGVCKVYKVEKKNTVNYIKDKIYFSQVHEKCTFTTNTKVIKNLTTNVVIILYIYFFSISQISYWTSVVFFVLSKNKSQKSVRVGPVVAARLDTFPVRQSFLPFYYIYIFIFLSPRSDSDLLLVFWLNKSKKQQ